MINYIIGIVVAALVIAIIVNRIIKLKKGETGCASGCGGCAMSNSCYENKKAEV